MIKIKKKFFSFKNDVVLNSVTLSFVIAAHFLGTYLFFSQQYLFSAIVFLLAQFVFALQIQWRLNNGFLIQDIRLWFVTFYFLYGIALPFSTLMGFGDMHGMDVSDSGLWNAAFLYASGLLAFNLVQIVWGYKWRDPQLEIGNVKQYFMGSLFVFFVAICFCVFYAVTLGVELRLDIDRAGRAYLNTQSWIVLILIVQGISCFLIWNFHKFKFVSKVFFSSGLLFLSLFFVLSLGDRRSVLPIIVFAMAIYQNRKGFRMGLRTFVLLLFMAAAFLSVGALRERKDLSARVLQDELEMTFSNNEFSIPIQNLVAYLDSDLEWIPRGGMTYLSWPLYAIPRDWWPQKPVSLSAQVELDLGYGFPAYTPVGEAYLNFLWGGPFMVFAVLSFALNWLVRKAPISPVLYFICLSSIIDFNRGEFGLTMYGLVVVLISFTVMGLVSRIDLSSVKKVTTI